MSKRCVFFMLLSVCFVGFAQTNVRTIKYDEGTFVGEVRNGLPNGKGKYYDSEGRLSEEGTFKNGELDGEGIIYGIGNKIYQKGIFKAGSLHGRGKQYSSSTGKLWQEGIFEDDCLIKGKTYDYNTGVLLYDGEYDMEGTYQGWGTVFDFKGNPHITGRFKDGWPVWGSIYYYGSNIVQYYGNMTRVNDRVRAHGEGTSFWSNGKKQYVGNWLYGEPNGNVNLYGIDGSHLFYGNHKIAKEKFDSYCWNLGRTGKIQKISNDNGGKLLATAAILGGAYYIVKNFLSGDDDSSSGNNSSIESSAQSKTCYSLQNVEIVDAGSFGALAFAHAQISVRNRNNYDVDVIIQVKLDGAWRDTMISYEERGSDRISGVDDQGGQKIRVKANSIRKINLRAKSGHGCPDDVRIVSVQ